MLNKNGTTEELLKIAAPCIAEQFMLVLVNMISIAVIGHLGSNELVASSMTNQLVTWLQCMYIGLSAGGTIVIARLWGEGDKIGAKKSFNQNLILIIILSFVILFLTILFRKPIISLFFGNASSEVLELLHIYFSYCMIAMPATAISNAINASIRGIGDNKTPFISTAVLNIVNLILSIAFIWGIPLFNISPMGIAGAGIAIVCARYISAAFTIVYVWIKRSPILPDKLSLKIEKSVVLKISKLGLPSAFEQLVFQGGFVILQTMLIGFGTVFQGGYQIGANLNGLLYAPAMGLSVALTVLISQALGKRDFDAAQTLVKTAKRITLAGFISLGALLFIFAPYVIRIYTSDPDILISGTVFARMFGIIVIPMAYFQSLAGILRGSGDVKYVASTSIFSLWVMRIFAVWIIAKLSHNGYVAVTVGVSTDYIFRAITYHFRVKKGDWRFIRI